MNDPYAPVVAQLERRRRHSARWAGSIVLADVVILGWNVRQLVMGVSVWWITVGATSMMLVSMGLVIRSHLGWVRLHDAALLNQQRLHMRLPPEPGP